VENGAEVLLILGNNELQDISPNIKVANVSSANEMLEKVKENLPADIFISAAAVCDFKIDNYSKEKIKKQNNSVELKFNKTVDILKEISQSKKRPKFVIGFAAESNNLVENAKIKLKEKNLDLIIANDIKGGRVFGGEENSLVYFIDKKSAKKIDAKTKQQVADKVLEYINNLYGNN
jgi:phosphopantothenoylcysteine decarboxylase/phosphopantothenate--cysteine ligase